jgi:imidazolonepropionase-like amidohydrolase
MKKLILACGCLLAVCARSEEARQQTADLVIADVTVISPERRSPLEHAFVRIQNGRITDVRQAPLDAPRRIDGTGRFLVPGLIDSHVHLEQLPMQVEQRNAHPEVVRAALAQEPRSYLYFGFTTVVDLANAGNRIAAWNRLAVRPDAWFCGSAPIANGYPMVFAPEARRFDLVPYFLYDNRQMDRIPPTVDPGAHTPEQVVARMRADGAICAKTYYETGFGARRGLPTPEVNTVRRLVASARATGMPVLVHANSLAAQQFALDSGAGVIAHGLWNGNAGADGRLSEDAMAVLDAVARRGVGYQPTMQVLRGEVDLFDEHFLANPRLGDALPASLLAWARTAEGSWFKRQVEQGSGDRDPRAAYAPLQRRLEQAVEHLAGLDATLLFGSDTPSGPTYANPPGLNGWWEIQRWADAGVSNAAIFNALTIANARAFGLEREVGSIQPGRRAHLLLLRQNPLQTVKAYDAIDTVILAGVPFERSQLSARQAR